jgi:shikimate dehydrogenase
LAKCESIGSVVLVHDDTPVRLGDRHLGERLRRRVTGQDRLEDLAHGTLPRPAWHATDPGRRRTSAQWGGKRARPAHSAEGCCTSRDRGALDEDDDRTTSRRHPGPTDTGAAMISGTTTLIAHLGYPTHSFKAPLIYNPWFDKNGIDAVVVPMGVKAEEYPEFLKYLFKLTNIRGALVTMPHKVTTIRLVDELTPTAQIAGAANAVLLRGDGTLLGDQFDGAGFVRGVLRKGVDLTDRRALVVGNGGVGSAIAASLAGAGVGALGLFDPDIAASEALGERIAKHYPQIKISTGSNDPSGYDVVVNATPLGMKDGDPLPMDVERLASSTFVGEVVMKQTITPFLQAAKDKGCSIQIGTDMLFEQIPAYLEFFGFGTATADELRAVAQIKS